MKTSGQALHSGDQAEWNAALIVRCVTQNDQICCGVTLCTVARKARLHVAIETSVRSAHCGLTEQFVVSKLNGE